MIGRLLRPASIVRLAAVMITTVCNKMINRSPTAVSPPGDGEIGRKASDRYCGDAGNRYRSDEGGDE